MLDVFLFVRLGTLYLTNELVCCVLRKNVNQEFLYQVLSSRRFENSMVACGQGAAQNEYWQRGCRKLCITIFLKCQ